MCILNGNMTRTQTDTQQLNAAKKKKKNKEINKPKTKTFGFKSTYFVRQTQKTHETKRLTA